jgi:TonB family protein
MLNVAAKGAEEVIDMKRVTTLVVCLVAWMAWPAQAGSIAGRVWDPTGAVVPAAAVVVTNADGGARQSATTGETGEFAFAGLAAGRYEVEVRAKGFQQFRRSGIEVGATGVVPVNVVLRLGQVMERLEVRSEGTPGAPAQGPFRVGGKLEPLELIRQVKPRYPEQAKAQGIEGVVVLNAVVQKDGTVGNVTLMSGAHPLLAAEAENAVRQWRYEPALLDGQPVEVVTTVEVDFRLQR